MAEKRSTDLLLLRHTLTHIQQYSGYENFIRVLGRQEIQFKEIFRVLSLQRTEFRRKLYFNRRNKLLANKVGLFYNPFSYLAEMEALHLAQKLHPAVIHNTFLEDNHGYLGRFRRQNGFALIATTHQPASWWKFMQKPTSFLQDLDHLLAVSTNEADFFDALLPGRVSFIRHGVDTEYFRITRPIEQRPLRLLFVGNWLRDTAFFADTITTLLKADPGILVDMVYSVDYDINNPLMALCRFPQVQMHRYISNEALLDLYNQSRLLFLPLKDTTANNAMMEAMACGLPIVTNPLPGTSDYTNDNVCYCYSGKDDCVAYLLHAIYDEATLMQRSQQARTLVTEQCSLEKVAAAHAKVYRRFF